MKPYPLLHNILISTIALSALASPPRLANECPGGRFIASVETIQRQNWIDNSPTVYDRKESFVRLPAWLGRITVVHATQGFLLSGEERIGRWTKVTMPPSLTVTMRFFGRSVYWPVLLPVLKESEACRDANGDMYVR